MDVNETPVMALRYHRARARLGRTAAARRLDCGRMPHPMRYALPP
jgi:hypothetical protein